MPQATRTHVFVDMKGYGRLMAERPNAEAAKAMRTYLRLVRAALPRKEVEVEQVADVFHLMFTDASEAVRTAHAIMRSLVERRAEGPAIQAGAGIDAGQTLRDKGRYIGVALVNGSVLASRARPGQILITQHVLALIRNELDVPPRDLGLTAYTDGRVHVFELRPPDLAPREGDSPDRSLVSLLFFDMVDSTAKAAAAGASVWKDKVERHHALVRQTLHKFRGVEVDTAGDGFYATFALPSQALDCAIELRDRLRSDLGIDIRAGVHSGECEVVAGKIGGLSVTVAARVMSQGGAGDVLVSQAVKDMLLGRPYVFSERGSVSLKGVPGEWGLFGAERNDGRA